MRLSRSLHGFWRNAVRNPLKSLRARLRRVRAAQRDRGPAGVGRLDDGTRGRPVRGPAAAARLAQCTVVEACRYRDEAPPAQRQFDPVRGDALRPAHGARAGDDARASGRAVLVPEARAFDLEERPRLAPFLPRAVPAGVPHFCQGDRRRGRTGRSAAPDCSSRSRLCRRSENRGRASADRQFRAAELRPLSARHRPADPSGRCSSAPRC